MVKSNETPTQIPPLPLAKRRFGIGAVKPCKTDLRRHFLSDMQRQTLKQTSKKWISQV